MLLAYDFALKGEGCLLWVQTMMLVNGSSNVPGAGMSSHVCTCAYDDWPLS